MLVTLADIEAVLLRLGIQHTVVGGGSPALPFGSLRGPGGAGVYFLDSTEAGAALADCILLVKSPSEDLLARRNTLVVVERPQVTFYRLMGDLCPTVDPVGTHPTALVDPRAVVHPTASIGPFCVIGRATVLAGAVVRAHVTVRDGTRIGEGVVVDCHADLGAEGVAWAWDESGKERIRQPQIGGVDIEAGCFLGSGVTIVRGSVNENTMIGAGCFFAPGTRIGHGARIDRDVHMANNVAIGGNVDIGARCFFGSGSVVRPRVRLAAETTVGAGAVVVSSVLESGQTMVGVPAKATPTRLGRLSGVPESPN